jgi:hypothetical protein
MIISYLASENKISEFSPLMVGSTLGWFGLLVIPAFLAAWVPLAVIRSTLGPNLITIAFLVPITIMSLIGIARPASADPYDQPFSNMLGATGVVWIIIVAASVLLWRSGTKHARRT